MEGILTWTNIYKFYTDAKCILNLQNTNYDLKEYGRSYLKHIPVLKV